MSQDTLHDATRVLRNSVVEAPPSSELTRARIMQSLHRQRRHRARKAVAVVPLAVVFAAASAAAASGELPTIWDTVVEIVGLKTRAPTTEDAPPTKHRAPTKLRRLPFPSAPAARGAQKPAETATDGAAGEDVAALSEELANDAPEPTGITHRKPEQHPDANTPPTPARGGPAQARADASYRRAHDLHFRERSPALALQAWDRYLAEYPRGRFAIEARYNRALCLVRLGRYPEARPALEDFASGRFGTYRANDAQNLLDAISAFAAPTGSGEP